MTNVHIIYSNDYGIALFWQKDNVMLSKKMQLVFRNTGLNLNHKEVVVFSKNITSALTKNKSCRDCKLKGECKSILLKTSEPQVSFAMSFKELIP
jgi:endonuclease III